MCSVLLILPTEGGRASHAARCDEFHIKPLAARAAASGCSCRSAAVSALHLSEALLGPADDRVIPLDSERDGEAAFGDIWVTHFAGTDVWRIHPSP